MHPSWARHLLHRSPPRILLAGLLALIFGARLYVGVRYLSESPVGDDAAMAAWLQKWSEGVHDWSFIWKFHLHAHPVDFYYLWELIGFQWNGRWDPRFGFLTFVFIHTLFAAMTFWLFGDVLARRDRPWIYLLVFALFALPFAGHNVAWGFLWVNSMPMLLALPAFYLYAHRPRTWGTVAAIGVLAAVAALFTGGGCLCGLAVAGMVVFNAALDRRLTRQDLVLAGVGVGLFLAIYLNTVPEKHSVRAVEAIGALSKALSWPASFVPGAGLWTLLPLVGLVVVQWFRPGFRRAEVTFATAVYLLALLLALAVGALRGDNNNMGMPSGRYVDFFILLPLLAAVGLCLLYRGSRGWWRLFWALVGLAWIGSQTLGFALQTIYRAVPFLSRETGEMIEVSRQNLYREVIRGHTAVRTVDMALDETLGLSPELTETVKAQTPPPAMTAAMMSPFDLEPGHEGNYLLNGYPTSYEGRPGRLYWGSFDPENWSAADQSFVSGPFQPGLPYITLDVLVDKKARFSNYRLPGLQLTLVDQTDGQRTELLPKLARTFPFVFRDWEQIYARVTPGHAYRLESHDTAASSWLAFSEPLESGRLTPILVGCCQSGKLLCLLGCGLLALGFYLRWLAWTALSGRPTGPIDNGGVAWTPDDPSTPGRTASP